MAVYMVGYDLHEGEDYSDLETAIAALSQVSAWHCLDSTWLIVNPGPAATICDALLAHLLRPNEQATANKKRGDELLVLKLTGEGAWTTSFPTNCQEWLRKHLPNA